MMNRRVRNTALLLSLFSVVFLTGMAASSEDNWSGTPWIGVYTQPIDPDLKEAFELERTDGILIVDVMEDSPAEKAGLERKDIIIKFNGAPIDGSEPLADFVKKTKPGDKVPVIFIRAGQEKDATIVIGRRGEAEDETFDVAIAPRGGGRKSYSRVFSSDSEPYIGVMIQNLNDQLGQYFGVTGGEGILVTEVMEDSPAEKAGLKAGDVIISADGEKLATSDELQELISGKKKGDRLSVGYLRKGSKMEATVEVDEDKTGRHAFTTPNIQMPQTPMFRFHGSDDNEEEDEAEMDALEEKIERLERRIAELEKKSK